jgi:hypothetical protein
MAAIVHDALCASHWAGHKPANYKGEALDTALKEYELAADNLTDIPHYVIPTARVWKIKQIDASMANLKMAIAALDRFKANLHPVINALKTVQMAADKAKAELTEMAKGDEVDAKQYRNAANQAARIARLAVGGVKCYL